MMISIPVGKIVLDGYFEYKQAINNMSIDEKIKEIRNNENKYSLNLSFIKLRGNDDLDIDYILENGEYNNYTKTITWENLSTDKLQFEFNNIEDDWIDFSGIVNICLVDKI